MRKRVSTLIIVLLLSIVSITNSFLTVKAEKQGEYYYAPTETIPAYNFFMGYGLLFEKYKMIGVSSTYSPGHTLTEGSYQITHNYRSLWNGVPQSTGSYETQFLNEDRYIVNPVDTVSSHSTQVSAFYYSEDSTINSYYTYPSLTGNLQNASGYDSNKRFYVRGNATVILAFISSASASGQPTWYNSTGNTSNITTTSKTQVSIGNQFLYKFIYTIKNNTNSALYVTPSFNFNNTSNIEIIPLYLGDRDEATDEMLQNLGFKTDIETNLESCVDLLEDIESSLILVNNKLDIANQHLTQIENVLIQGTTTSQQKTTANNNKTTTFNNTESSYHNIESNNLNTMQTNLDNISTTNNLYTNNGFLEGAWFVRYAFNNFISKDSTGSLRLLITFSLVLGIALTIIGKLRN